MLNKNSVKQFPKIKKNKLFLILDVERGCLNSDDKTTHQITAKGCSDNWQGKPAGTRGCACDTDLCNATPESAGNGAGSGGFLRMTCSVAALILAIVLNSFALNE